MATHTPGPWIFYADLPSTEPNWHIITTENRLRVLANVHIEPGNATDKANARLIAAAPDLLEALLSAEKALEHDAPESCWATGPLTGDPIEDLIVCPGCRALGAIRAAIAKTED